MPIVVTSLEDLKCDRCVDGYAYGQIHGCREGHIVCPGCLVQERCPACNRRLKIIAVDVGEMENQLRSCANHVRGCKKRMPAENLDVHERHCDFKEYVCGSLFDSKDCSWAGVREELTKHYLKEHRSKISDGFKHDLLIENFSQVPEFQVVIPMTSFSHLFLAKLAYDVAHNVFFGGVQFVSGAPDIASRFRYEFEIGKETGNAHYKYLFSRPVHALSDDYDEHTNSDHFTLEKAVGNVFADIRDTLTVTVILKDVNSFPVGTAAIPGTTYGFVPVQYCQRCVRRV
jgi:hypothetical protein